MTVILESSRQQNVRDFGTSYGTAAFHNVPTSGTLALDQLGGIIEPSERDMISIIVLHTAMQDNRILAEEASAFLLHTAALQYLPLGNRRPSITISNTAKNLVCSFTQTAASVLRNHKLLEQLDLLNLPVNLADLLDGFLLASLTYDACLRDKLLANPAVKEKHDTLLGALVQASGGSFDKKLIMRITTEYQNSKGLTRRVYPIPSNDQNILPFKNAVFDKHLAPVHLHLVGKQSNGSTLDNVKVFQELSHWHNHKKAVAMKGLTQKLGFFARRRIDLYMAEMHAYAASLTNAAGRVLDPETIIVNQTVQPFRPHRASVAVKIDCSHQLKDGVSSKGSKKTSNPTKKSGKTAALEAAAAFRAVRAQSKEDKDATSWKVKCRELLSERNVQIRYTTARDYSIILHQASLIRPEVELFTIDCLLRIWMENCKGTDADTGARLTALIWVALLRLSKSGSGMTPEIVASLKVLSTVLRFPILEYQANAASRPLVSTCVITKTKSSKASMCASIDPTELPTPGGATIFQLEHCGPYLDRAIDSAPDTRSISSRCMAVESSRCDR
jgi:hypothetical protein